VPVRWLSAIFEGKTAVPEGRAAIRTWYRDYDYLYLVGPAIANPLPDLLEELDRSGRFALYKIRRTP
jgi:hypothetical protein